MKFAVPMKASAFDVIRGTMSEVVAEILSWYYDFASFKWDAGSKELTISFDDPEVEDEIFFIFDLSDVRRV